MGRVRNSKLSGIQINKIVRAFATGLSGKVTAQNLLINRHTVERIFLLIRRSIKARRIAEPLSLYSVKVPSGEVPIIGISLVGPSIYVRIVGMGSTQQIKKLNKGREQWYKLVEYTIDDESRYIDVLEDGTEVKVGPLRDLAVTTINFKTYGILGTQSAWKRVEEFMEIARDVASTYNGFRRAYILEYLAEIEWRFNTRNFSIYKKTKMLLEHLSDKNEFRV